MWSWILTMFLASSAVMADTAPAKAILAGGCFWCVEHDLRQLNGVLDVVSGYTGGSLPNPTYQTYHDGHTGHVEAVQVTYDPRVLDYPALLAYFLRHIDPTDGDGQFCDRGDGYRPVIFTGSEKEKTLAHEALTQAAAHIGHPTAVDVLPAVTFWPAEDYHQRYAEKNPTTYKFYRWNCGRDKRVKDVWEDR